MILWKRKLREEVARRENQSGERRLGQRERSWYVGRTSPTREYLGRAASNTDKYAAPNPDKEGEVVKQIEEEDREQIWANRKKKKEDTQFDLKSIEEESESEG